MDRKFRNGLLIGGLACLFVASPSFGGQLRSSSAGSFVKSFLVLRTSGQFGALYRSLHPAQQAFVSRDKFIDCENQNEDASTLGRLKVLGFRVLKTYQEKITVPGTSVVAPTTVVKFEATVRASAVGTATYTERSHAARVNGQWKWMLPSKDAVAYKVGRCRIR